MSITWQPLNFLITPAVCFIVYHVAQLVYGGTRHLESGILHTSTVNRIWQLCAIVNVSKHGTNCFTVGQAEPESALSVLWQRNREFLYLVLTVL
jgi:hypothetical protein